MSSQESSGQILILSGVRGDTRRYRTLHLHEQLRLAGMNSTLSHLTDPRLPELIQGVSVAVFHRVAFDSYVEKILSRLRGQGALVILDADDFLYDPEIMDSIDSPDFQDPVRAALYRAELLRHRATLERCDGVTVSTDFLASLIAPFDKPVRVHRNAFSLEMLALSQKAREARIQPAHGLSGERVVIGYASGTRTHDQDFAMIQPALCGIMERNPQVELWLMGAIHAGANWGQLQERVKAFPLVPWRELPARLAMLDINLAPLVPDNPFNQAKSEIKYMEAALVSIPTIASRTDAFTHAIRSGQNGFLAGGSEEWEAALERLIMNENARRAMGETAYQEVLERYSPSVRGQEFIQLIADLAGQTGSPPLSFATPAAAHFPTESQIKRFYITAADEAHPTMPEMAWYSIRHRGLRTLLGQVWVYFRRKLSPVFPFQTKGTA